MGLTRARACGCDTRPACDMLHTSWPRACVCGVPHRPGLKPREYGDRGVATRVEGAELLQVRQGADVALVACHV